MFPLNDFNFVACALATFSAAVGYNVSRRRGRNTSASSGSHAESERAKKEKEGRLGFLRFHRRNSVASASARSASAAPSSVDLAESDAGTEPPSSKCGTPIPGPAEAGPEQGQLELEYESFPDGLEVARPEDGSLKRKRSPAPRLADADTPPFKRRRTPPAEKDGVGSDGENASPAAKLEDGMSQLFTADDIPGVAESTNPIAIVGLHAEVSGSAEVPTLTEQVPAPGELTLSPASANVESSAAPALTLTAPSAPPPCLSVPATTPSIRLPTPGPSWHTGTPLVAARPSSAFSAFTGQGSAFASSCTGPQGAPAWTTSTTGSVSVFGNTPSTSTSAAVDPLAASTQSTATAQKVLTGEEDEEVETELKGAKVFIKRGDRDFCEGILGNVKLLKHKETGDHRILFRREPVWKVTMSVRLRPTVRCSFDEAQSALRVTLREPIEDTQHEHLVIYALKRGKASRSEFAAFAKTVAASARLQEQQGRA